MFLSNNPFKQPTLTNKSMMESLQLPLDMFWDGKSEPMSPPLADHLSRSNLEEFLLYDDECLVDDLIRNHQNVLLIADDAEQSGEELLVELDLEVKNELWLDEKSNQPPPLEELSPIPSPTTVVNPFQYNGVGSNNKNTEELLMEFEQIYDAVELTHLTPPQTPPQQDQSKFDADCYQIFNNFQQQPVLKSFVPQQLVYQQLQTQQQYFANSSFQAFDNNLTPASADNEMRVDAADGLQVVDELVRSHCQELPDFSSSESCASSLSPPHSEISYSSNNGGHYSSSVCSNDEDWTPSKKSPVCSAGAKRESTGRKRRLPGVDKKSRKKEQNKNAATRYRQKKKAEIEVILEVERELAVKNEKLQTKYKDIRREVKYLKNLMRELLTAKGVLG